MKKFFYLVFFGILVLAACKTFNYTYVPQPLFLQEQSLSPDQRVQSANLSISRVETNQRTVRLHVHLMDSSGTFYNNLATSSTTWCSLSDSYSGVNQQITDFRVYENRITEETPTAYALVLDHSGSMANRVRDMQDAVEQFIRAKNPQDAIAIVKYDKVAKTEVPLSSDMNFVLSRFRKNGLEGYGGLTAIQNGIHEGIQNLIGSPYQRKVVISFTDGGDNSSNITTQYVTWLAQSNNILISTIDLGRSVNQNHMKNIASATGGTYNYMMYANEFPNVFSDIKNRLNRSYIIEYTSPGIGSHQVNLTACLTASQVSAVGYYNNEPVAQVAPIREAIPPANPPKSDDAPRITRAETTSRPVRQTTARPVNNQNSVKPLKGQTNQGRQPTTPTTGRPAQQNTAQQTVPNIVRPGTTNQGNTTVPANQNDSKNPATPPRPGTTNTGTVSTPVQGTNTPPRPGTTNTGTVSSPAQGTTTPPRPGITNTGTVSTPIQGTTTPPRPGTTNTGTVSTPVQGTNTPPRPGTTNTGTSTPVQASNPPIATNPTPFTASTRPAKGSSYLLPLQFKAGSAELTLNTSAQQILNQVANSLNANPDLKLRIEAHMDNLLPPNQAINISNQRANAIKSQLTQRNVSGDKIEILGKGSAEPVADNNTNAGRAQNNRIVAIFF